MDNPLKTEDCAKPPFLIQAATPLLPLIAQGNLDAVDRFVERYGGLVWTLTKKMTKSTHDAEDLVQEIFIELWKKAALFDVQRGSEIAFISVIAKRRVFDRLRKKGSGVPLANLRESDVLESYRDSSNSLEIAEEIAKVRNCLSQLSPSTQDVLKLILQDGMSHQEVSTSLKIPLGTVKSFSRRGLLTVRDCVKRPFIASTSEAKDEPN